MEDYLVLLAETAKSTPDRVALAERLKLYGALFLLTMGCIAVVLLAWLALRIGRRSSRREDLKYEQLRSRARADDWANKPLVSPADSGHDPTDDE